MVSWSLSEGAWQAAGLVVLICLLIVAAWIDVRHHRIPNLLVLVGVVVALLLAHGPGGSLSGSLVGIAVGLAMGLPLYVLRAMGAGDVKLMGMVGAFLGGSSTFAAVLVIFAVGGLLGLVAVARRRAFAQLGANLKQMTIGSVLNGMASTGPVIEAPRRSVGSLPYGVAIAAGTILYLAFARGGVFQ